MANTDNTTPPLSSTILSIEVHGHTFEYLYTRITSRCYVLTALETGKAITFRNPLTLWDFFSNLIKHLNDKYAPRLSKAQAKARQDFLDQSERYFRLVTEVTHASVGNYTRSNYEWQISNARLAAGQAASRFVQFVSMGI